MKVTEETLDKALELSLRDLRKNLGESGERNAEIGKTEVLMKAREMVKAGKLGLLEAGNIEQRINKGIALKPGHMAILGLKPGARIAGLKEPAASSVEARMNSRGAGQPGGSAVKIDTGAPIPTNPVVAEMSRGQTLLHSFQQFNNEVMTVTGAEILKRCQELVRKGEMTLLKAGDIERAVNGGAVIRPEVLRAIFA